MDPARRPRRSRPPAPASAVPCCPLWPHRPWRCRASRRAWALPAPPAAPPRPVPPAAPRCARSLASTSARLGGRPRRHLLPGRRGRRCRRLDERADCCLGRDVVDQRGYFVLLGHEAAHHGQQRRVLLDLAAQVFDGAAREVLLGAIDDALQAVDLHPRRLDLLAGGLLPIGPEAPP